MTIAITNESKNSLAITNESKDSTMTWDSSYPLTWDEAESPWDAPRRPLVNESKNTLAITNESKL